MKYVIFRKEIGFWNEGNGYWTWNLKWASLYDNSDAAKCDSRVEDNIIMPLDKAIEQVLLKKKEEIDKLTQARLHLSCELHEFFNISTKCEHSWIALSYEELIRQCTMCGKTERMIR